MKYPLICKVGRATAVLSLYSCLLLLLAGCSASTPDNEPKEVTKASLTVSAADQLQLLKDAEEAYEKELYTIARENFQKLHNSYALGPYAEFAQIKIADSYFIQGQYSSAATAYEGFIKEHPASVSLEYALTMAGRSFQLSNHGVGKDPSSLTRALEFYNRVISDYPTGIYSREVSQYQQEVRITLAQHDESLLNFYHKTGQDAAYAKRLVEYKDKWQDLIAQGLVELPE